MSIKEKNESIISAFIPLWEEILSEFTEYSFNISEIRFKIDTDNKTTKLIFSKKLQREFIITLFGKKKEVNISTKNESFTFLNDGTVLIKEGPSLSLAMMQILITHTRNRLKEEKREKIKKNKVFINTTIEETFKKNNIPLDKKVCQVSVRSYYKKGTYYAKISCIKKGIKEKKFYSFYDDLMEELEASKLRIEVSYEIK